MRCEGCRALCCYPPGFPLLLEQWEGALREDSLGLCILGGLTWALARTHSLEL